MFDKNYLKKRPSISWNNCRKNIKIMEILFIIIAAVLIIIGTVFDNEVQHNIIRFQVDDFNSFVLTVLGIQATVTTLTVALVALISNNIFETYLGVSVSQYYLNIRPFIFKQNRIIYISFILIGTSCIFYVFRLYNLLLCFFAITIILMFLSSYEIYFLFRGLQKAEEEIELYVLESIMQHTSKSAKYKTVKHITSDIVSDWSDVCAAQTQNKYNTYKHVFINAFETLIKIDTQEGLPELKEDCGKIIRSLLKEESEIIKARGVELLINIYESLWSFVISDSFNNEKTNEFNLFGEVDYLLDETLKNISFQHIRENFNWEYFTDLVARSVFCLAPNNSNFNSSADLQALLRFSENIANIVKFKETYNNEHMDDTIAYWGRDMCGLYLDAAFNIPENRKKEYLYFKCNYYFHYCKGFIDNGYMDLIKENIFFRSISNLYYNIDNSKILYYLSIDCYLYYLSEKESQACVDSDLQSAAKKLLEDKQIVNLNDYFFSRIHCLISGFESLENDLLKVLKKCEWFPKYGNSKTLIMEDVVREFYIFMQTIMNHSYSYTSEGSYKIIAQPFVYVNQFLEGNEERTKESLKRFYSLFKSTSNDLDIEVKAMYLELESYLKTIYKNEEIKEAAEEQKKYEETVDEDDVITTTQEKLTKQLESVVGDLEITPNKTNIRWAAKFNLLNCRLFTNMINNNVVDDMYSDIIDALCNNIINELLNRKLIKKVSRLKFKDDNVYLDYLKNNNVGTLIGLEYVFTCTDYKNKDMFNSFFKELHCIFYGWYKCGGVALKKNSIKVKIKNVEISIRPISLSDYKSDENDIIKYNVTNDITIPFQKNEFMVYINNKRKMLNVTIEVEFITRKNNIGVLIDRNDYN